MQRLFSGLSSICADRSIFHGRLEAERLPVSAGPGYLRVSELHHWHLCHSCIALDLAVQFKLSSGIRAWAQIWVQVQLGTSGPHCTKWVDDQYSLDRLEPRLVSDLPLPTIIDLRFIDLESSRVLWETETNIYSMAHWLGLTLVPELS